MPLPLRLLTVLFLLCATAAFADDSADLAFVRRLESAMAARTPAAFDAFVDYTALKASIIPPDEDDYSWKHALIGFEKKVKLGPLITGAMGKHGSYRFLRFKEVDGQRRALFRLNGDKGLNYHELVLSPGPGNARIADVYIVVSGERISHTLRRAIRSADAKRSDLAEQLKAVREIRTLAAKGKAAEALAAYEKLPAWMKQEKWVQLARLEAAGKASPAAFDSAAAEYRKQYPDDVAPDLAAIALYDSKKQYARMLEAVDHLETLVGPDPYLNFMRALARAALGQSIEAKDLLRQAIEAEPTLFEAHETLLKLSAREQDHAAAVKVLEGMKKHLGVDYDVSKDAIFADLRKSAEYLRLKGE